MIAPGTILISSPSLQDPNFQNTVVLIAESNANGHLGFVLNKKHDRRLNDLVEFSDSLPFPLFVGGPVDQKHLYFFHRRHDLIPGGSVITEDLLLGGDFKEALQCINSKTIDSNAVKLFTGYCGWDAGELEAEIEEGSWIAANSPYTVAFDDIIPPLTNLLG